MRLEQLLLDDQKRIRGLFRQLQVLEQRAPTMISGLAKELSLDLQLHAFAGLDYVLPELFDSVGEEPIARGDLEQAREAYLGILRELEALASLRSETADWENAYGDFRRTVELHFDHELRQVFPLLKRLPDAKSSDLVRRILDLRRAALAHPDRREARPSVAQNPGGGEQKRKTA